MKCPNTPNSQVSIAEVHETLLEKDSDGLTFYSALSCQMPTDHDTSLIENASQHISGFRGHLHELMQRNLYAQVTIEDYSSYFVEGVGTSSLKLNSGISLQLNDVLFVPEIKRNLVSISTLEDEGYCIAFADGQIVTCPKNSNLKMAKVIGVCYGYLYRLRTLPTQALFHDS